LMAKPMKSGKSRSKRDSAITRKRVSDIFFLKRPNNPKRVMEFEGVFVFEIIVFLGVN